MPTPDGKKIEQQRAIKKKCGEMVYGPNSFFSKCIASIHPEDNWAEDDCRDIAKEEFEYCLRDLQSTKKSKTG